MKLFRLGRRRRYMETTFVVKRTCRHEAPNYRESVARVEDGRLFVSHWWACASGCYFTAERPSIEVPLLVRWLPEIS